MTYKRASFQLLTLVTGVLCFMAILLSTPWGAQLTFYILGKTSVVQIEYQSGALLNNLQLKQVAIKDDTTAIKVSDIRLQLHLRCLWKNELCIDHLNIGSVQVRMKSSNATSPAQLVSDIIIPQFYTLPLTLKMKQFTLAKLAVKNDNLSINLTEFSSALSMNNRVIKIDKTTLANAQINLFTTPVNSVKPVIKAQVQPLNNKLDAWPLATLPKVYLPFKLSLSSFTLGQLAVNEVMPVGDNKALFQAKNTTASLTWFESALTIDTLSTTALKLNDTPFMDNFSVNGDVSLISPYRVDITATSEIENSELLPQLDQSKQDVSLQGDLAHLAITANSRGSLALTADAFIDLTDANLPYKLTANVTKFTLPSDVVDVIQPSIFSLTSQGDMKQHTLDFTSEFSGLGYQNVGLTLVAKFHDKTLNITTLHLQDRQKKNAFNLNGELQFGSTLSWHVKVDSSGITLPNIDQRISGRVQGNIQSKGFWRSKNNDNDNDAQNVNEWAFSLVDSALTGTINQVPLTAKANIDINHQGKLAPSDILFDYGDIALKLKGYSDEQWHVTGSANIGDTSLWVKSIESRLNVNIAISGPVLQPELSLQGEFEKFLAASLGSEAIGFDATYRPMNNHAYKVTLTSALMHWNDHTINNMNVSSQGDFNQQAVNVAWLGDSSIDLTLNSQYSANNGQWQVTTDNTQFSFGNDVFKSNQPLKLVYETTKNTLAINQHCWAGAASELCLNNNAVLNLAQGNVALALKLDSALLTPFIPEDIRLDGSIDGNAAITWQPGNMPSVDATWLIRKGHIQLDKDENLHTLLAWEKGQLNVKMQNNNVDGNMALFAPDNVKILSANTFISLADMQLTNSEININDFSLSPLQIFVPELALIEGKLNSKLTLNGDVNKPIIKGEVAITEGKTKILGNINTLENINVKVDFNGQQAVITGGVNVNKTVTSLTGNIDWQGELEGDLSFDGDSVYVAVPPDLTLTVSPHIKAKINALGLKLSGRVEVLDGKLSVNKLPQGSVSVSKDVIIVNEEGEQVITEQPFEILTNIRVVIADAFKIEGQGFIGRLGGELQVSQQSRQPLQLFGSLKIPEGRYRAYGQDLSITKSNISFNGPVNNPYVSIRATRSIEREDIIVGIDATGLANSLNIKLFSKPTMQQSDTLSYLVRGRGLDAETNDSNTAIAVTLGSALTNFSGVLTQIEKLPLINRIEVDGDDKQASIAGYLGDQVYIKYGVGVLEPINELTVRFYFLSRLWVEAVSSLENSANIYYSFDIN